MNLQTFIENYRRAFGEKPGLPLAFWYSDIPAGRTEKIAGCLFRCLPEVRAGNPVSLNAETIGCGGGKFYTGFADMPQRVPCFVSLQERYKETPELVTDCLEALGVPKAEKGWLNLARIDRIEAFDGIDGLFFPATPDMLSGLVAWAMFDTNAPDAVSVPFGSGCCTVITQAVLENRRNGKRVFLGLFDPSVRPWLEADGLGVTVSMSRFWEMYETMPRCCLFDTPAWEKVRKRIDGSVQG